MQKVVQEFLRGTNKRINSILFMLAVSTAFFSFGGLSIDAETFLELGAATVFAIASGAAIYLFWSIVIPIVPNLQTPLARYGAYFAILIFMMKIIVLSSLLNVTFFAGKQGQQFHQERFGALLERSVVQVLERSLSVRGVAADLRLQIDKYTQSVEAELSSGAYSGTPGPGAVVNALNGIKGRLDSLDREVAAFLAEADGSGLAAATHLDAIRKIVANDESVQMRMRQMGEQSDELRRTLATMDPRSLVATVARTLDALPREVDLHANYSRNAAVAAKQKAALDRVRADAAGTAAVLQEFLREIAHADRVEIAPFRRISAVRSVIQYWDQFPAQWAGGISLDVMPLAVLIFFSIAIGSRSKEELAIDAMMEGTFRDAMRLRVGEALMRGMAPTPESKLAVMRDLFGINAADE